MSTSGSAGQPTLARYIEPLNGRSAAATRSAISRTPTGKGLILALATYRRAVDVPDEVHGEFVATVRLMEASESGRTVLAELCKGIGATPVDVDIEIDLADSQDVAYHLVDGGRPGAWIAHIPTGKWCRVEKGDPMP